MPGMGFGTHPHRDMEIITYILSGALEHKDSMGNGRVIRAGEVQYMAAGTGVQHSEFNPSKDEAVHLLQIWIQPDRKGVTPRYAEKSLANAARRHACTSSTSKTGRDGSIAIHQDADLWLAKLEARASGYAYAGGRPPRVGSRGRRRSDAQRQNTHRRRCRGRQRGKRAGTERGQAVASAFV